MTILIVEDKPIDRKLLYAQLEAKGHVVAEAHDGVEALELLDRQHVDVVISDILMPRMDGYRLCYEIRKSDHLCNLPTIIYSSTYTSPSDVKLAFDVGANKFLNKPSSVELIIAALNEVIATPQVAPSALALPEVEVLKEYSQRLVEKLRERNLELEKTNAELKKAERQLLEKTAFFEAVVSSALEGVIVVDNDFKTVLQNQQMIDLWRTPEDIALEVDHRRRLEWINSQVNDSQPFPEKVSYLYAHPGEVIHDELALKDGRFFERYSAPVENKDGRYLGRIWVYHDITERKRNEARFRLLVDSNVQGVLFWNRSGRITGGNDAFLRLVRYTREDLEAGLINWFDLTPPEYAQLDSRALEEIAAHGASQPYEKEFVLKDGSRVPILLGSASFKDNPDEGVAFVLDLTERKKLEQQFLRAQRMESIGTLASGIAHDLNNILAPIMMSIELLKHKVSDPQGEQMLATIEVSARQGADIVRQVLSFARGLEGECIEIQPKHLLLDLENIIKGTFPKNIQLAFGLPNGIWTIWGDPTQVQQILLNLCVNARDAMPNGGRLTVEVENCVLDEHYAAMSSQARPGRYVQINVTDSGTGMSKEVIDKIFEPFFTTKAMGKGTGLGLSTVVAIVKSHEGIVNVYSEPGKGTTFKVYLPAVETSDEGQKKLTQPIASPRGNGETVLVIDDEASILTITSQTLQAFGYRVLTATDGEEAVAVYAKHADEIAVVLTDMMMPVMDGAATIRALERIHPSVRIIAASGLNANGTVAQVPEPSVKRFLTKPYTAGTLLTTLRATLDEPNAK